MFDTVRKFARAFRVPTAQDREIAYLNEARDRIDLEFRMRQVDRGMFRFHECPSGGNAARNVKA